MTFYTTYKMVKPDGSLETYASFICAPDVDAANILARKRNIGEVVCGPGYIPKTFATIDSKHFGHWTHFLGFVALKAGYTPEEIFGDEGILHSMIHLQTFKARRDGLGMLYNRRESELMQRYNDLLKDLGFIE